MDTMKYSKEAEIVTSAIKSFAKNPENLDNFECYLSMHFDTWLKKFANSPENLAFELQSFAEM